MTRLVKEQDEKIKQFLDVKGSVYQDERCVISRAEEGLVCAFKEDYTPSRRQVDWMQTILYRTASKEYGENKFKIEKGKNKHFYFVAYETNTAQTNGENREDKQEG